ncbi:hypothetical protein [Paenibacillus ginsengarvi]|uniref:Uncharacterized protein n=1 Tax=Paenibacillus ginsengarvi TaxID=400777 RepID=A0A3B0BNJ8_9BACL|nr:hypothetical protein [Paenibacillus ginsengarvi]RKN74955.1 hypothetical protein D7M11_25785 [Paenibacillus ginsengarvi]
MTVLLRASSTNFAHYFALFFEALSSTMEEKAEPGGELSFAGEIQQARYEKRVGRQRSDAGAAPRHRFFWCKSLLQNEKDGGTINFD